MPRAGLTEDTVVERAAELLERNPSTDLTLAAVAESLGVRTPSLYKHVDGLPGLRRGMMLRAKRSLGTALARSTIGRSRDDAVRSLAAAYRSWALENPVQYGLTVSAPEPEDADDRAASEAALEVLLAVLAGYDLRDDDAIDAARFLRSALHGFVSLETTGAFRLSADLERSYRKLIESVVVSLASWSRS
ncbi:TetR/AcrR family transcriptional regulator [Labedella phragmitis]|uniref:TetR/AcrR family transcriptional regulator n=1 Tax=Labedella phragmitis TaxID=2498849 RepID=A0A3S4ANH1_9MICO|nr:TetR/AcrR family transcriptional regulator [Labedella phragmitis]RWZ52423.1 TetR/AcrR family transcriptional regulator [Labedella phragmitis]